MVVCDDLFFYLPNSGYYKLGSSNLANYKIFYVLVPHIKDENNDVFK
jgi:hypothetical protein